MENDLISRSAILEAFKNNIDTDVCQEDADYQYLWGFSWDTVESAIQAAPSVDAVEVVRCEDCEAWNTKAAMSFLRNGVYVRCCPCGVYGRLMYDNDFCSKGKRRGE